MANTVVKEYGSDQGRQAEWLVPIDQNSNLESVETLMRGVYVVRIITRTGWNAADLTFYERTSFEATWKPVQGDSGDYKLTATAANKVYPIPPWRLIGASGYLKIVSSVAQANNSLLVVVRKIQ